MFYLCRFLCQTVSMFTTSISFRRKRNRVFLIEKIDCFSSDDMKDEL
jgi:hypothetical protein